MASISAGCNPRKSRAVLRGTIAGLATFACVQLCARIDTATGRRPEPGPPPSSATAVDAPPPEQLTDWSFYLGGSSLSEDDWTALAERAVGVRGRVNDGDFEWVAPVVALESMFFEVDDRLACAARYGDGIQNACRVRYDLGIERESATEGRVVYSRGTHFVEDEVEGDQAACEIFLKCMVHTKLGGTVPIPEGDWSEIVLYQLVGLVPARDELRVPENLRVQATWCDDYERELKRQIREHETEDTAFVQAKILSLENQGRYLRWRAETLEEEEDAR